MPTEKTAHVAAFAFPFGSHAAPLLHLVQRLAAAAPAARFSFFNTAGSNQKILPYVDLKKFDNIRVYEVENGVPEGHVFSSNPTERIELFIKATPDNFRRRLEEVVEETGLKATCLLTDAFLGFSSEIAAKLEIRWVAFWTAGAASVSLHMYTDEIRNKLGVSGGTGDHDHDHDRTLDFLPGMATIHAADLPRELLHVDQPFPSLLYNMSLALPRAAAALILNSFDGIDPDVETDLKSKLPKVLSVGPFPLPPQSTPPSHDQSGCLQWLSNQAAASVAYISFGTMLTPPPPELTALAEALEEKQVPYLWSIRSDAVPHPLKCFFERTASIGKAVEWAPQLHVLNHAAVGVFVTHCGWNSVMESIACGVPMVCRPFFGDQMINRRRVEEVWRIGVGVEGGAFTKASAVTALDVVRMEKGGEFRGNVGRLKECAHRAAAENGSSSENFKSLVSVATCTQC